MDEDCDATTIGDRDVDGDGFVDARCCNDDLCGEDCDDTRRGTNPNVPEVCDRRDNDCDGSVDEEVDVALFRDLDRDLHGDPEVPTRACAGLAGYSSLDDDCDDRNPASHRAQVEVTDGLDNDCDARVDESATVATWYVDGDDDGFGAFVAGTTIEALARPEGYSLVATDCDDADPAIGPLAAERCNAVDDDCNGAPDFVIGVNDWEDDDGDGFADVGCPAGVGDDCDDGDADAHPGAGERCNGRDDDCDATIDEACDASGATSVRSLALGNQHAVALFEDGTARWWGGYYVEVSEGVGSFVESRVPIPVPGLRGAIEVTSGANWSCARLADGSVRCWGNNRRGFLGDGTDVGGLDRVVTVRGLTEVVSLDAGVFHTCARRMDGTVWCWGGNDAGQLGDGTTLSRSMPVQVPGLVASDVAAGRSHTCAVVAESGAVVCWGDDTFGQLARGSFGGSSPSPVTVTLPPARRVVSGLGDFSCAILVDGGVRCWGEGTSGQLGSGMLANAATPRTVGGDLGSLEELALGGDHACSRRSDGSIRCWGANTRGQMGVGTSGGEYATPNLAAIDEDGAPLSATRIVAGVDACCARTDDAVRCWGANAFGQLGDGTTLDRNAGVEVAF